MQDRDPQTSPGETLALARETIEIGKRRVVTGRVRVRTETEHLETVASEDLEGERIEIERVPMDVVVEAAPAVRTEGDLTIFPVVEEVLVVETRLVLVEELHVRRVAQRARVEQPVTLRRQRAIVERLDPETGEILNATTLTSED